MHPFFRIDSRRNGYLSVLLSLSLALALLPSTIVGQQPAKSAVVKKATTSLTTAERNAAARIKLETIRDVTATLSSPQFEGRGTGQHGGDVAAQYIADRFAKLRLKPLGENGTYLQPIKFKSTQVESSSVTVGDELLTFGKDYVALPGLTNDKTQVTGGLVFVGYGVVAPELKRDDLAGLDLKGKVVVLLNGQPNNVDTAAWRRATNPQVRGLNIFGRGAAAMIVGNAGTSNQPFKTIANYLSRRRVSLASQPAPPFSLPPILLASDEAMGKVMEERGATYAEVLQKAMAGENVSRDLNRTAMISINLKREESTSSNVAGVLEGSDPKLKDEAVVFSAHYDAYGKESDGRIFPGAADNALGVGTIVAIAEAFAKSYPRPKTRPRRSVIFLAVTGEEYGLLGTEQWVQHPAWPLDKIAADINFDGIGTEVYAPVKRVVGFGAEFSDLGAVFNDVAAATGTVVTPDPMPEERAFTRSDHYAFVKKGVPALMLMGGPEGDVSVWIPRARTWLQTDYHSTTDTIKPEWNWTGPQTLAKVGMIIALRVANAEAMPAWLPGAPYKREAPKALLN
jgi:hypothetical protein